MAQRSVCVVTGSRAEYGILYWLLREIAADPALQLQLIVTGMHLSPEFGMTYRAIEADGFVIDRKVEMLLSSDSCVGMAKSVGLGVIGFADAYAQLQPDVVVVLGDRFEIFAAVQAAYLSDLPVAHISGGEITEGALDDGIRHAISKLSRLHFVSTEVYRRRVIQLGESPDTVFNVGALGLDNLNRLPLLDRTELSLELGFDLSGDFLLVTYHPATLGDEAPCAGMLALLEALECFPQLKVVLTKPNADAGGRALIELVDRYAAGHADRVYVTPSLGQLRYLSAMKLCAAVVGNSSSGLIEAPTAGKPAVNIGVRQAGRMRAESIIDCPDRCDAIVAAITTALTPEWRARAALAQSPFGDGQTAPRIKDILKNRELPRHAIKHFHDL
ncbi:UDP-N-acetylglucosamine 2-epimerase [Chitinimonas lacunae]|uniref:UDP-N-acetylglucosamine 2-epimerase n=1 Tax=Chitinimonas lacunae TaxID=1963018 RepID=A0ABV8MVA6_9NEIS